MRKSRPSKHLSTWADRAFAPDSEVQESAGGPRYQVGRCIGRGGMGEVYEARHAESGQRFALKCLRLELVKNARTLERTRREALTLRDLRHANVVRVHATGVREDGLIWMVMDLLEGHTLAQVRQRMGRLPLPWALRIGRAVTEGLSAVHAYAVHRDVKPENVHLGDDAVVRVLDLGAGKFHHFGLLTTCGSTVGTVPYMSPEQLSLASGVVDARSDVFSLGVMLAELVSGVHPFAPGGLAEENVFTLVNRIVSGEPVSLRALAPWAPGYVVEVVDRASRKDREQRFASAAEMGEALAAALERLEREVGPGEPLATLVAELNGLLEGSAGSRVATPVSETRTLDLGLRETEEADTAVMRRG
jgi:eukaryotic-like serine/threonine-protein kinase